MDLQLCSLIVISIDLLFSVKAGWLSEFSFWLLLNCLWLTDRGRELPFKHSSIRKSLSDTLLLCLSICLTNVIIQILRFSSDYKYNLDSIPPYKFAGHVFFVILSCPKRSSRLFLQAWTILRLVCPVVKCGVNCEGPRSDLDSVSGRPTPPSWARIATGAGSRLWLAETTSQATGTHCCPAHQGISPNCTQAVCLMGFSKLVNLGAWAPWKEAWFPIFCLTVLEKSNQ